MSMAVNAANYQRNMLQNTKVASTETHDQKDEATTVGKTQQSAVSASLDQVNMGESGIAITEVSRQQGTEQSAAQKQSVSPRTDIVEISAEGRAASTMIQDQQTSSSVEDYETDDLSEYTDTELKQMYYRGEITRQEYEKETGEKLE